MKFLLAITFFSSLSALGDTSTWFADRCSGEAVSISTPNPTTLYFSTTDLNPDEDIKIYINYRPAGILEDLRSKDLEISHSYVISKKKIKNNSFSGYFKIPKAKWLWEKEQEHSLSRVWEAEVKWIQPESRRSDSKIASFYHSPEEKSFYKIESNVLCKWEGSPEVSSKLYENNTASLMNVMKSTYYTWNQYTQKGLTFGYNRNFGGNIPLGASDNSYGWLYKDWQRQVDQQEIISVDLKFILNVTESGVFYNRMTFNRLRVSKYAWNPSLGQCGQYEKLSKGLLDVGVTTEDFVVMPKTYYPFPEKMVEFINIVRPPINTCKDYIDLNPQIATDVIPSGFNGIMFFYEEN
jgi:hypothetical protein